MLFVSQFMHQATFESIQTRFRRFCKGKFTSYHHCMNLRDLHFGRLSGFVGLFKPVSIHKVTFLSVHSSAQIGYSGGSPSGRGPGVSCRSIDIPQIISCFRWLIVLSLPCWVSRAALRVSGCKKGSWDVEKVHAVVAQSIFRSQNVKTRGVRTTFGSWDVQKVPAVVARSTFRSQNVQNTGDLTTFGSSDVEKVHAVVARSTFWSQNVQNTPFSDHFWKLRCRKSARRCGAKHISKSKCTKHTRGSDHFWRFRCRFASLQYTTVHYATRVALQLHYTPLHYSTLQLQVHNCTTTLHYTRTTQNWTLHYTTVYYTPLHSPTLHYITQHYNYNYTTTLHYTPLH